ncbi:hypothetical protein PROPEN_03334 [Proteus penneri ATCC 35198]|nr:hypothetical protein PROPEN_03334 [Proteus penneri ATCC 35198]
MEYGDYLAQDPTLSFRHTRTGRYLFDNDIETISRLEYQPFVLTEEDGFIREDSGAQRHFRALDDRWQSNTAYQALLKFKNAINSRKYIYPSSLNRSTIAKINIDCFSFKINCSTRLFK